MEFEIGLLPLLADSTRLSIDVGANAGEYAAALLPLSREVHLFEPFPDLGPVLQASFASNPKSFFYPAAISDRVGFADLRVPRLADAGEWNPLGTIDEHNDLSGRTFRSIRVMKCTIDSLELRNVGFIKIDTEGHELAVVIGAMRTIISDKPNLLIEAEERHRAGAVNSIASILSAIGYKGIFRADEYCRFLKIEEFRRDIHQREADLGNPRYCANFLFSVRDEVLAECSTSILRDLPTDFDASLYLELNPDVASSGMDPASHFMIHGWSEERRIS